MKSIEFKDYNTLLVDGEVFTRNPLPEATESKPICPFKQGAWLMITDKGYLCSTHPEGENYEGWITGADPDWSKPVNFIEAKAISMQPDACICSQGENTFIFSNPVAFRHATKEEIESHLVELAEEKGYVEGVCVNDGISKSVLTGQWVEYRGLEPIDDFAMSSTPIDGRDYICSIVYSSGKWAEIIPAKKSLPKTREDFEDFIDEWGTFDNSFTNFLDQYNFDNE